MKKKAQNQIVTVKVDEENPEPLELMAKSIIEISEAFKKIEEGPLSRRVIVLLLQDLTKLSQRDINLVLHFAPKLKQHFIKEIKKKG